MYIEDFIDYISSLKRYSPHTIKAYRTDLSGFFIYLDNNYDSPGISDISHQMIRSWVMDMMERGVTARSVNRKISTLKTFYRYLRKNNLVVSNPLDKMITPKTKKSLPEFVSEANMDLLFDEVFGVEEDFISRRNKLILEMFYSTGIRLSELVNLQVKDIDLFNSQIKVLGKRNKERIIPFGFVLGKAIRNYMEKRNESAEMKAQPAFFLTEKGHKVYNKLVYRIVNSYLSTVSTLQKNSPHILRHTFATHMLNNGADLNTVKELLGHANLGATQVYTHNTIEKLKTIYNQAHPRA